MLIKKKSCSNVNTRLIITPSINNHTESAKEYIFINKGKNMDKSFQIFMSIMSNYNNKTYTGME